MENRSWKILLVEDDEDDYILTRALLSEARGEPYELNWAGTYEKGLEAFRQGDYNVYLVDYRLGEHDGLELVRTMVKAGCRAPIILMTGQGSYDVDLQAMKSGATDYLVKSDVTAGLLERTIRYAIERKQHEEALRRAHDELELRVRERTQELAVANAQLFAANERLEETNAQLEQVNDDLRAEIREREQAQQALSQSETRFRKLAESTSTAIFILQDQAIRYANPAARVITGYSPEELMQLKFWQLAHPAYQRVLQQYGMANQWIDQVPSRYELKMVTKTGRECWVDISSGSMELEGHPALVVTAFDITERDQAERALKKAKEELEVRVTERTAELSEANRKLETANHQLATAIQQLQTVLHALPVAVWISDGSGRIIDKNEMADTIWHGNAPMANTIDEYGVYKGWFADTGEPLKPEDWALARALKTGETVIGEAVQIERLDGTEGVLLNSAAPIKDETGAITGAVVVSQDITQRMEAEEEMRRDAAQIEVQRHLIQFREMERLNIARDLHDGPLQELIGIAYNMTDILQVVSKDVPPDDTLLVRLYSMQERIKGQIRDLRVFCSDLRPPTLVPFGLEKAIRSHAEMFQRRHPDLDLQLDLVPDGHLLDEQVRLVLFRIYQEILNNVIRHSRARQVQVHLELIGEDARLEIHDNGQGFEVPTLWVELARQGHLGLVGAQERAEAVGGTLHIFSAPGSGTRVQVTVPVHGAGQLERLGSNHKL